MRIRTGSTVLIAALFATMIGCGKADQSAHAGTPADSMVKLSQYGHAQYCSIASGPDGTLHAIYTDFSEYGKPAYLFYRSSTDGGVTWTDNKNLSDDESGLGAAYCRIMIDGKGRAYAIWKYVDKNALLDGPGGYTAGYLSYRCLEGGTWSKTIRLAYKKAPAVSWFAAMGPDNTVNVVWSQGNSDVDWATKGGPMAIQANLIQQAVLDGSTQPTPKGLIVPDPVPTKEQIDALHAAHKWGTLEGPASNGLWDLRGYIDPKGVAHFVAEHTEKREPKVGGRPVMYWDGTKLTQIYEFEVYKTFNNFNNPWVLLQDPKGKEHLIRAPEKSEKECVRDYSIDGSELSDPTDVIAPDKAPGKISNWQAGSFTDGTLFVLSALSQKGGYDPDDTDLFISTSQGDGKWTTPVNVTNNAGRATAKTSDAAAVFTSYRPAYAEAVKMKDGVGLLIVNTEKSLYGINRTGVTDSGRVVTGMSTGSGQSPWVFFHKM